MRLKDLHVTSKSEKVGNFSQIRPYKPIIIMPFRRCSRSSKRPIEYSRTSVWPNLSPISLYVSKCDCFTILLSVTRFSKAPETFRARKAIFSSSVSEIREVHTLETSCMKRTSFHIKNIWINCSSVVNDILLRLFGCECWPLD